jgi:hypothetical protein
VFRQRSENNGVLANFSLKESPLPFATFADWYTHMEATGYIVVAIKSYA